MKSIAILIATLLAVAGCTSRPQSSSATTAVGASDLVVSIVFVPDPPQKGLDKLTITIKDSADNPVSGAAVTLDTSMPAMSMAGPSPVAHDNGDGTYSANLNAQYATAWQFVVSAKSGDKAGRLQVSEDVK